MGATAGFLYPGYSAEDDYPAFQRLLGGDVTLRLVHTLMREDAHRVDALLDVGGPDVLAEGARTLREQGIDAIVWACTSGSFVFGWEGAARQVAGVREVAGVPASSTSFAFVNAVRHLGLGRVAVAATYPDDVAQRFVEFLRDGGIEVASMSSRGIVTAAEVGTLPPADVLDFVARNDHPDAEAVLVPDTALHSAGILDDLERRLGKPVLTANQVSVWEGLRLAGETSARSGLGTLFRTSSRVAA
ncbi:maleate cis-trans isomerase family protein [Marinitenerispora sediminis]|uniref:Maleate cis-trans isomerase n=1 Tax=Marinitenerispora sediminis TaxID=1931232 RepID=A0A368T8F8_9ACTN|nr:maleate cis-trans isomerase [Marinitenerispora sediminis]RCV57777.1 maleate cis-trans isomerase [Marinitenerispora sediminis]RCV57909.1 maleate cis-trans isomerase [Marinitenerispora sediminis]RCV60662.1 maleate cis-trans isomerase [Marinitenerispora sediminis]